VREEGRDGKMEGRTEVKKGRKHPRNKFLVKVLQIIAVVPLQSSEVKCNKSYKIIYMYNC